MSEREREIFSLSQLFNVAHMSCVCHSLCVCQCMCVCLRGGGDKLMEDSAYLFIFCLYSFV